MAEALTGTVLVVDDTEANRYVIGRLLSRAGHRVLEAASGAEGEAQLVHQPHVVLIDMNLGDMLGSELAQRIKANPRTSGTMVVNMSAVHVRTQDRVVALEKGADGYLTQPIDPQDLLATVGSLLRIRRAEDALRQANQQLEHFAYLASHDLQEPLRMISSYLSLLRQRESEALDERSVRYLDTAVDAAQRMGGMIRSMLSLATADQASIPSEPVPLLLPVRDALAALEIPVRESGASVMVGDLPSARIDVRLMAQVFQNLIGNALKFRAERPLAIAITVDGSGDQYRIQVADNGLGVADDDRTRIFSIFERAESSHRRPGSGIGLALCRRIVEGHGGRIGVEPRPEGGSVFWFTLPK